MATEQGIASALERLEKDTRLDALDERLRAFDVFEILKVHRKELQHSNFLRYLFDPRSPHGLGVPFLREFLRHVAKKGNQRGASLSDKEINRWDLASCYVLREWERNDLRISDSGSTFVIVVENKIDDTARDGQLEGYRLRVERQFPSARRIFVYLTPGEDPANDSKWTSFGYAELAEILSRLVGKGGPKLDNPHRIVIEQYLETLRKHVLEKSNSNLVERANRLYLSHQLALDYIFENRASYADSLHTQLHAVIANDATLRLDSESDTHFRFIPKSWDRIDELKTKIGWNDGSLITVQVHTPPARPSSKVSIHAALHLDSSPRLGRMVYKAIEGKSTKKGSGFLLLHRRIIAPPPTEENRDFNRRVAVELSSFISQELPKITRKIRRVLQK